jgi:hypothetical protein
MVNAETENGAQQDSVGRIVVIDPAPSHIGSHNLTSFELLQAAFAPHIPTFYVNKNTSTAARETLKVFAMR